MWLDVAAQRSQNSSKVAQVWACFDKVHKHIVNDVNEISLAHLSSLYDFRFFIWLM